MNMKHYKKIGLPTMYINHDLYNNEFIHVLKRHKLM